VLFALSNGGPDSPETLVIVALGASPIVGFLVGSPWVLVAVPAAILGRTIGWDPAEHDGASALWLPHVLTTVIFLGGPLSAGVLAAYVTRWTIGPFGDYRAAWREEKDERKIDLQ
jgi:hypothetical protein